ANPVAGLDSDLSRLLNIGVTTGVDGQLKFDRNVLFEKLDEDLEGVIDLFRTAGHSDTEGIEFLLATDDTVMTSQGYNVNITQVATKGNYQGIAITDPAVENLVVDSTNNKIKIRLNGILSETIELTQKTYTNGEELAAELQSQINDDENLGSTAVSVTWIDEGDSGYFEIESELYGSSSDVEALSAESDTAATLLGFVSGTKTDGLDVEGTINGETAHGIGQILKADDDNETTSGLSLKVTLDEDDLNSTQPEGSITLSRGVASLISYELNKYTDYIDGSIASRVNGLEKQMEIYNNQLENLEARLDKRRAQLYNQFYVMEQVISQLQNQQSYFASQIAQLG
ncbi:MAG: flagellar filament capping protein FliD, partial [candidate division Zixibacteria bacterium]|nr:flagellar filament capping protein FliD [candidate division Zixibacteria bacterium]